MACLVALATLCAYRFYSYWTTGFFVSDEYGYYYDAVHGSIYADRWFFGYVNIFLFKALGINSPDPFSYLLPFYMFFWTATTFVVFYKLLRLLRFPPLVVGLSLASCFALISFILLSLGFLTEPVGLCLAMIGIYFLAKYMRAETPWRGLLYALLAACFFGFAAGTREPYNAFLLGGVFIILLLAYGKLKTPRFAFKRSKALVACSVLAFAIPSMFFLFVPTQAYSQQVAPIGSQLITSVVTNPQTTPGQTVTTVTSTITVTAVVNNTTTTETTTTTAQTTVQESVPFYRQFVVTNTLLIFFGGIVLGWGPICVGIAVVGVLILLRRSIWEKEVTARFLLVTSIFALGSYFVVSFIYAPDPYYFSFSDYSTVIRFSDTALPAYFLTAPLALAAIAKSRKRMLGLAAVVLIFLTVAVPTYETYATSNLSSLGSANPFVLSYRTPGAEVRNYFSAHQSAIPVYVAGLPYGWVFTPGAQNLRFVNVFSFENNGQAPYLNSSIFVLKHWGSVYIYSTSPSTPAAGLPNFIAVPLENLSNSTFPYSFSNVQTVASDPQYSLLLVTVDWH